MTGVVSFVTGRKVRTAGAQTWHRLALVGSGALVPLAVGSVNGGYFPTAWGWLTLLLAWAAALLLVLSRPAMWTRFELTLALVWVAVVVWVAATALWSPATTVMPAVERDAVYAFAVVVFLLAVQRASVTLVLGGLAIGVGLLGTYSLATRLFPDRLGTYDPSAGYRLTTPVGYWNALGMVMVVGMMIAVGFAARGGLRARAAAGAGLVPMAMTLYFTFSRGSVLALAVGLGVSLALDPRRLQLAAATLCALVAPAVAVWRSGVSPALTHRYTGLGAAAHAGHRLAFLAVLLTVAGALLSVGFGLAEARWTVPRGLRAGFVAAAGLAVVVGLVAVMDRYGSPTTIASHAWRSFSAPPSQKANLNTRLFSISNNDHLQMWHTAWREADTHLLAGGGAGSFEAWWDRTRRVGFTIRNAHSLYLESLAELGIIGAALIVAALALPLFLVRRVRQQPLLPIACGAYVAFVVHAGVDWDWEVPVVVLSGLICGLSIVAAARSQEPSPLMTVTLRRVLLGSAVVASVLSFVVLAGNIALSRSANAARAGNWQASIADAKKARTFAPWSTEPLRLLGEAQLGLGDTGAAVATFQDAIKRDPGDWNLWFDLAQATTGSAQRDALAHATKLNPLGPQITELQDELRAG